MSAEPERLDTDPAVASWAYRWRSERDPRVTYDVAWLLCETGGAYIDCTCPGFSYRDQCKHVQATLDHRAREQRREDVQAVLDARLGCRHPLTVDEAHPLAGSGPQYAGTWRTCLGCGHSYDRGAHVEHLRRTIRERHRLPSTPWTASERASDPS